MIDALKIEQVIINLLSNAIKYSPGGGKIMLTAIVLGDQVQISVQDPGIGIGQEHLEKIFKRFYRVPQSNSSTEGLGLGLYARESLMLIQAGYGQKVRPAREPFFTSLFPWRCRRNINDKGHRLPAPVVKNCITTGR